MAVFRLLMTMSTRLFAFCSQSQRLATALLTSVGKLGTSYGDRHQVTLRAGMASVVADDVDDSAELLLRDADDALYRAKHAGRNRVVRTSSRAVKSVALPKEALADRQPATTTEVTVVPRTRVMRSRHRGLECQG